MSESDSKANNRDDELSDFLFTELVLSFQAAAWQQMGKVPSIVSCKVERNLEMAKHSIDLLGMLEEKTKGNISEEESKLLGHVLFELRLNYLDELRKGPVAREKETEGPVKPPEQKDGATLGEDKAEQ